MKKRLQMLATAALFLAATPAMAASLSASLPDYDGERFDFGFPVDHGVIGTFTYSLPVDAVISAAFFEGTYGTPTVNSSTAPYDAVIEGFSFTVCEVDGPGCFFAGAPYRPFSLALSSTTFAGLLDGSADLQLIQTNFYNIRLGSPTLRIVYGSATAPVPEPASWAMTIGGFGIAGGALRRSRVRTKARLNLA